MTPATALTNQIRAATSKIGARLFPMTIGKFWGPFTRGIQFKDTRTITVNPGDVLIRRGHMVSIGTKGMSDLLGSSPLKITEEHFGMTLPILTAVEVKAGKDQLRPGQPEFLKFVTDLGGRAGIARTVEDAVRIVRGD